jgi:mRNA interferase HigB
MRILGKGALHQFGEGHADCREWLSNWISDVAASSWTRPQVIRARYSTASFLADNVVVFNVRGNNYRLEVQVGYRSQTVVVKWIGTHAEYSRRHK